MEDIERKDYTPKPRAEAPAKSELRRKDYTPKREKPAGPTAADERAAILAILREVEASIDPSHGMWPRHYLTVARKKVRERG